MATSNLTYGKKVAEGKTKVVWQAEERPNSVVIESKDDITAGDGAKHDVIQGKAELSNATTCNVFRLLESCEIFLAFQQQVDGTRFLALKCDMIPLEVVVRREAHGSYLKRNPHIQKGHVFPRLILEFFLKTTGKVWEGESIPVEDPFIRFEEEKALLFRPDQPIQGQKPFLDISADFLGSDPPFPELLEEMGEVAIKSFLVLEKAWQILGRRLVDFKVEFGRTWTGQVVLADVIDNDSWRLVEDQEYLDKQLYRDGGALSLVKERYQLVRELTERFFVPSQCIILWRGSKTDDVSSFKQEIDSLVKGACDVVDVVASLHKEPIRAIQDLTRLVQEVPDSVVIAFVGRSNGAGPTLSANTTVPVITVPASWKELPEDVWSSLRVPSKVPVLTALEPKNAVLAALQILAMRNPWIYAELRIVQEKRFVNTVHF